MSRALRLNAEMRDPLPYVMLQLEQVRRRAWQFDLLHFHVDLLHFPIFRELRRRTLTTLHGRLDLPDLAPFYAEFADMPVVSVPATSVAICPWRTGSGPVHHGLPTTALPFTSEPGRDYLAFIGRISPQKRPDHAIAIAQRAGM